jgi:hypothetical protein
MTSSAPQGGKNESVRYYWATAGATALLAAIATGIFTLLSPGTSSKPDSPPPSPTSGTSTPSRPPIKSSPPNPIPTVAAPPPPASYVELYQERELKFPDVDCPRKLEIDFESLKFSRDPVPGADGYVCDEGTSILRSYEARGTKLVHGESGATAEQCRQWIDDGNHIPSFPFAPGALCVLTSEGTVVYLEGNIGSDRVIASAWKPAP